MDNVITFLPRSRARFFDVAQAVHAAGQRLWHNGRVLVAAPHKPGAGWFRVGVKMRRSA